MWGVKWEAVLLTTHKPCSIPTYLRRVNLHLMERIDCDEDVSHICVNLISAVSTLKLLCDRVLTKRSRIQTLILALNESLRACQNHIVKEPQQNTPQRFSLCPATSPSMCLVLYWCIIFIIRWSILLSVHRQVHQQQPSFTAWRMGGNIRWQRRPVVSFNTSTQRSDLINCFKCSFCKRRCCVFLFQTDKQVMGEGRTECSRHWTLHVYNSYYHNICDVYSSIIQFWFI